MKFSSGINDFQALREYLFPRGFWSHFDYPGKYDAGRVFPSPFTKRSGARGHLRFFKGKRAALGHLRFFKRKLQKITDFEYQHCESMKMLFSLDLVITIVQNHFSKLCFLAWKYRKTRRSSNDGEMRKEMYELLRLLEEKIKELQTIVKRS